MKVKLIRVFRSDKDKQGNPLETQDGRKYTRVGIKTKEHGDKWVSGFGNSKNADWKAGDEVEINIEEKGQYLNFSMPKEKDLLEERIAKLEENMEAVLSFIYNQSPPKEEIVEDEPPF